jgi:hypothetical protein
MIFPIIPAFKRFGQNEPFVCIRVIFAGSAVAMSISEPVAEFRSVWLPHVTDDGLNRLVELLEKASPLLIHGAFTRAVPMGCLATHIAWNHPQTCRYQHEAGVMWLSKVAGLNPATSAVILAWDRHGAGDFALRTAFLEECQKEATRRSESARSCNEQREAATLAEV